MKKRYIIISMIFWLTSQSMFYAQEDRTHYFIGVNPSVTIEPFYEKGELDINILPIVYQSTLTKRLDIRVTSILNLGIRNNGHEISHYGIETGLPVFFRRKEAKYDISRGLFIAPILSVTRNRAEEHNNLGLWIEPGYNLLIDKNFAISFGLQFGATYFAYDMRQTQWRNHFGFKVVFGKWF